MCLFSSCCKLLLLLFSYSRYFSHSSLFLGGSVLEFWIWLSISSESLLFYLFSLVLFSLILDPLFSYLLQFHFSSSPVLPRPLVLFSPSLSLSCSPLLISHQFSIQWSTHQYLSSSSSVSHCWILPLYTLCFVLCNLLSPHKTDHRQISSGCLHFGPNVHQTWHYVVICGRILRSVLASLNENSQNSVRLYGKHLCPYKCRQTFLLHITIMHRFMLVNLLKCQQNTIKFPD